MIGNRRVLCEPIAVVVLPDTCIDVFLILVLVAGQLRSERCLRLLVARRRRWRRRCRVTALLAREGDVLVDGGKRQAFANGKLARKFAVCVTLVRQLVRERVEHRILIRCRHAARIGEEREDVLRADRLVDDDIAGLERRRRGRIVIVDSDRMSAVLVHRDGSRILLIDDAALFCAFTAEEVLNVASANIAPVLARTDDFACADVLDVLIVALIARFVEPLRAVLQIEIRIHCVDDTVQPRFVCCESNTKIAALPGGKEITVELHIAHARRLSVRAEIHRDAARISGKRIVAVFHAGRHLYPAAARKRDCCAAFAAPTCRYAIAVDRHIHIAGYVDHGGARMRQYAGVVVARKYIFAIERDAPFPRICTGDLQIAVDANACTRT